MRTTDSLIHRIRQCLTVACVIILIPAVVVAGPDGPAADSTALETIYAAEWEWALREDPLTASHLGDPRYNDRWPDVSLASFERRHAHRQDVLKQLDKFDPAKLAPDDRLNYRLFRRQYELDVEEFPFHWHLIPLNQREGIQDAGSLADVLRLATLKDYHDWLTRLDAFPAYLDATIVLMREGIRRRIVLPRIVMERVPHQIARQIVSDPEKSLFYKPFRKFPDDIAEADRTALIAAARQAILEKIVPAYRRFAEFFEHDYLPACPGKVGAWQLPRGKELYEFRARQFTTTRLTPQEIHEIGQREVRRIRAEMELIVKQVGFQGTFKQFLDHLRTDPQFYYKDPNELMAAYLIVCKKIDPQLPKLFRKLPRIPYGVEPIPEHIAPDTTTAYYRQPSADGSRAGMFFVNLYRPEVRPKYEMEALSLHEAVPGHHLQIA
ncbi:MAG: DUF885 domain-containing protein, partial [Planctomycetia bacterium]|nr:DUF885 domain-containing protein [Planctomycetia bacterium]